MLIFLRAHLENLFNGKKESIKWRAPDVTEIQVAQQ
jgi:hypothetical protein